MDPNTNTFNSVINAVETALSNWRHKTTIRISLIERTRITSNANWIRIKYGLHDLASKIQPSSSAVILQNLMNCVSIE